jgi:hypothetical protein
MSNDHRQEGQKDNVVVTSLGVVGVHLLWMFVGPLALGFLLFSIAQSGSGWLTGLDLGLLLVVVLMLCARWIDQRSGQATTVYGEPSTWATFQRYALVMPIVAGVAWIVANVIGNHLLTMWGG